MTLKKVIEYDHYIWATEHDQTIASSKEGGEDIDYTLEQ